jgi:membrane-bound serine protease (ClpP class)
MGIAAAAFSSLPVNWLGVAAVAGGVALMVLELKASKHGLLLIGGIVCVAAGSVVLYALPGLLSPFVLLGVVLVGIVLGVVLLRVAQGVRRLPPMNPLQELVGARGVARTELNPDGVVHVNGQMWSAHVRGAPVAPGEPVRVVARRGLVLEVMSASFHAAATQKGANR